MSRMRKFWIVAAALLLLVLPTSLAGTASVPVLQLQDAIGPATTLGAATPVAIDPPGATGEGKGENKQAAAALLEAARMLAQQPEAMQLRYLQTMTQVAGDRASTIVFPLPMDLLGPLLARARPAPPTAPGSA